MKEKNKIHGIKKDTIYKAIELLSYVSNYGISSKGFAGGDEINITDGLPDKIKEANIKRIDNSIIFHCSIIKSNKPAILKIDIYPSDKGDKNVNWKGDSDTIKYVKMFTEEINIGQEVVSTILGEEKSEQTIPIIELIDLSKTAIRIAEK